MYLSHLLIEVGNNPDRERPGRRWLRNIYRVHQRLCMAFPTEERRTRDPYFLKPFNEDDFPLLRNTGAVPAGHRHSFLFRIDGLIKDRLSTRVILVQSQQRPDWEFAFRNARILLAAPPEVKEFSPCFKEGDEFRFRIRVNLSRKAKKSRGGQDLRKVKAGVDAKGRPRSQSKRIALIWDDTERPADAVRKWFDQKAQASGFALREFDLRELAWITGNKGNRVLAGGGELEGSEQGRLKFRSALIDGKLAVTDSHAFARALAAGIGSAKAFGFGLLSIARV